MTQADWLQVQHQEPQSRPVAATPADQFDHSDHSERSERYEASRRAFECDLPGSAAEFAELAELAEHHGWRDVVRASLYGVIRHMDDKGDDPLPMIEKLKRLAEEDGDDATLGLALAWRAWVWINRQDAGQVARASLDLARASVILEATAGDEVVRASAHLRLAFCYLQRRLFELADEQYAAAAEMVDAVDPQNKDPLLHRAALAYNRVTVQLDWACGLREMGDADGVRARHAEFRAAFEEASLVDMPEEWRTELRNASLLMDATAGIDRSQQALAHLDDPESSGDWTSGFQLCVALCPETVGVERAAAAAEEAIALFDPGEEACYYDLAMHQACVLEAMRENRTITAGLRAVERLAAQRDVDRSAALLSMRSIVASERLRAENDVLSRHAYLDHLTGMANRRALDRYLSDLRARRVESAALLVIDVDHFKSVNDRFGHLVGDEVLRRLGAIFGGSVRSADFAARIGGDEFVIVMAGSSGQAARDRAEAILCSVSEAPWTDLSTELEVSVSIGLAAGPLERVRTLTTAADKALYIAKAQGGVVAEAT